MGPFYVNTQKRPWLPRSGSPRRAAVSSVGVCGSNFHCVLEEYRHQKSEIAWDGSVELVAFSAAGADELRDKATRWLHGRTWEEVPAAAAQARAGFRAEAP